MLRDMILQSDTFSSLKEVTMLLDTWNLPKKGSRLIRFLHAQPNQQSGAVIDNVP